MRELRVLWCTCRRWFSVLELLELELQDFSPSVDTGEIAVVKGIAVLLHDENQAVQEQENRMSPRPLSEPGPPDDRGKVECLPDILNDPAMLRPVHVAFLHELRQQECLYCCSTHDTIRQSQHENITTEHQLHDLVAAQNATISTPVVHGHLDENYDHREPEQGEETEERAVRRRRILSIECCELAREDEVSEAGP